MDHASAVLEATRVAEVAKAHAEESERGRRLAAPVVDAFEASGLAGLMMPTALGGAAAHPGTLVDVVGTISAGDPSAGWCAGIGIGCNATSAVLNEAVAKEMFADPHRGGLGAFPPGGRVTSDGDGLKLNGRWGFGSNCHQAAVAAVGTLRIGDNGAPVMTPAGLPEVRMAFIRAEDFAIDETWDMSGMRGTGSHDIVAENVALTEEHLADLFGPRWPDDALFRLRMFDMLLPCLAAVPLGIGRAALDEVLAHIDAHGDDPQRGPRPPFGLDPATQIEVGHAEVRLRAARALVLELLDQEYDHALRGDVPPRQLSALAALAGIDALAAGNQAVDTAVRALGTSASREGSLLDRLRRDIASAGGHVLFAAANAAYLGRQAAGMYTVALPFLPPD